VLTDFSDTAVRLLDKCSDSFADSIRAIDLFTSRFAVSVLLSPVLGSQAGATHEQRTRACEIVQAHGHTPLARFTLFEDKSYFFSTGGSLIAYTLQGKAAITLGDPIGPDGDGSACIAEFREFCKKNHWLSVFYQVLPDHLKDYERAGFDIICIGQDAVVDLSTFSLAGPARKNIRNSYHKMARLGYTAHVHTPLHSPALMRELNEISNQWLSTRGGFEIGFSLGQLDETYLSTCPIIVVRDANGCGEAFANVLFEFQTNGAIIDMMRYRPGSKNGLMDFLFASVLMWSKEQGLGTFNLGFSPFSGIGETPQSPGIERLLGFIHGHVIPFPNFKGLHFFKEKFDPIWSPRYLIYPGLRSLPGVGIGIMRTYKVPQLLSRYFLHRT
jgi:phosphatidylglycerol lysyltransferase